MMLIKLCNKRRKK